MRLRRLVLSLSAFAVFAQPLASVEDDTQPTAEYQKDKAELEDMLSKRDLELFELQFIPGNLGRVSVPDRNGNDRVFNYLTFTVRNQTALDANTSTMRAKGYNEVLQSIAEQYEIAKVSKEEGAKLSLEGIEGKDGVIVERSESKPRTRTVSISALVYDENGTRIRLLDEPPGSGPQETFAFPDLGEPQAGSMALRVKEKVEEAEGTKLLSVDDLRTLKLAPFDGVTRIEVSDITDPAYDMKGWFVGEARGVLLFTKLSDLGDKFTVHVNGLCNKLRFRSPQAEAGKPENYFQAKVMRRTWVLEYSRPGDEYFRDQDHFDLVSSSYRWVESFQRTDIRRTSAYSRYFLSNIMDEKGDLNAPIHSQFWPWYDELRAANSKLPDLKAGAQQ